MRGLLGIRGVQGNGKAQAMFLRGGWTWGGHQQVVGCGRDRKRGGDAGQIIMLGRGAVGQAAASPSGVFIMLGCAGACGNMQGSLQGSLTCSRGGVRGEDQ